MEIVDIFLERVKDNESLFPTDSFPTTRKKKKIIRTIYPENKDENMPKRAMIDFDGTIHKFSKGYQAGTIYDDAFDGAKEVIDWLKGNGFEIVIFTSRASGEDANKLGGNIKDQITKVGLWLNKHDIYFDKITAEKLPADFYIDDKAIHISSGNWDTVLKVIKKRIKYKLR